MSKKCGYSFWGYLGDVKCNMEGKLVSTPDGNAFYSWCIIRELQKRGYEVTQIMPDRDVKGYELVGDLLFSSWLETERLQAYDGTKKFDWSVLYRDVKEEQDSRTAIACAKSYILTKFETLLKDMDFILHEYRMYISGRNDYDGILDDGWQPDYLIQECIFEYCCKYHKKLILFDLDYKVDYSLYHDLRDSGCPVTIFELGTRWTKYKEAMPDNAEVSVRKVYIPFDFDNINYFSVDCCARENGLVYIGNRYERDWCIDKYIPTVMPDCIVYGNWLEGDRDSQKRWPMIRFGNRLQTQDMREVYSNSTATILLAKKEYCDYGFMTARIIESIFYGTVPLFIEEYGSKVIKEYAGDYADFLTVKNSMDVCMKVETLENLSNGDWVKVIIEYLRDRLKFMDVKYFVNAIEEVL